MITIRYDFIPYINQVYSFCKKRVTLYKVEEHPEHKDPETKSTWPGKRSLNLSEEEPFLYLQLMNLVENKFNLVFSNYKSLDAYIHLRLEEDDAEDWIHTDTGDTILIYLSPTNLSSGTSFYSDDEQEISAVKFVQNTALFFNGQIKHKSVSNYGENLEDGRMTINIFCNK